MERAFAGMILVALLCAAAFTQSTASPPAFEVADVHASPYRRFPDMDQGSLQGDRYVLRQATMVDLIATAYGVDGSNVQGGPPWLETDRFEVTAKVPAATTPATAKLMLRSLLQDRFQLVIHDGSKPMPAFVLTIGKGKPKMTEAEGSGDADCKYVDQKPAPGAVQSIVFSCHHTTMEE